MGEERDKGNSDSLPTTRQLDGGQLLLVVPLKRRASPFDKGGVVFGQGFDVFLTVCQGCVISGVDMERRSPGVPFTTSASWKEHTSDRLSR